MLDASPRLSTHLCSTVLPVPTHPKPLRQVSVRVRQVVALMPICGLAGVSPHWTCGSANVAAMCRAHRSDAHSRLCTLVSLPVLLAEWPPSTTPRVAPPSSATSGRSSPFGAYQLEWRLQLSRRCRWRAVCGRRQWPPVVRLCRLVCASHQCGPACRGRARGCRGASGVCGFSVCNRAHSHSPLPLLLVPCSLYVKGVFTGFKRYVCSHAVHARVHRVLHPWVALVLCPTRPRC